MNTGWHRRLCAATMLGACGYTICRTPLLPLLARDLGATPTAVGFIVGASTITGILVKLPAGAWSDILGRRVFLIGAGIVFTLLPLAYVGVASLGMLLALRFVHGSATGIFSPVSAASVSDIAPSDRRATWLMTISMMQGIGQALAPLIAGLVLARAGYDAAFLIASGFGVAVPLLLWRWPAHGARCQSDRWQDFRDGVSEVIRDRSIVLTSVTQAVLRGATSATAAFLPLYASEALGLSPLAIGVVFALQAVAGLASRPIAGRLSDRAGRSRMIAAGLIVCGSASAFLPLASDATVLAIMLAVMATGVAMTTASASALITDRARQANYGAAHGVFGTVYDIGDALGPMAGGLIVATLGYRGLFGAIALLTTAAGLLTSAGRTRLDVGELRARRT